MTPDEAQAVFRELEKSGSLPDEKIDIAATALILASLLHPGLIPDRYKNHLAKLAVDVKEKHAALRATGMDDSLDARITALRDVLSTSCGYGGDEKEHNQLHDADIIHVIDSRAGSPVALAVLYLHAAQAQGWEARGLDIPGGYAVRMEKDGERAICDPSAGFRVMQAFDLRRLVKRALGKKAELSASYYEPVSRRAVLIRLQNIVKTRQIEAEDYESALCSVLAMRAFDPGEYRLLLDQGVLCARLGIKTQAVAALEDYIVRAPKNRPRDRHEAAALLQQLKNLPD